MNAIDRALAIVPRASVSADFDDKVLTTIRRRRVFEACVQLFAEPLVSVPLAVVLTFAWQARMITTHVFVWMQHVLPAG